MGRQCSPGVAGSRDHLERRPPSTASPRIRRLLQQRRSPHRAAGFADRPTHRVPTFTGGPSRWIASSRRPPSSLRVAGSSLMIAIHRLGQRPESVRMNKENRQARAASGHAPGRGQVASSGRCVFSVFAGTAAVSAIAWARELRAALPRSARSSLRARPGASFFLQPRAVDRLPTGAPRTEESAIRISGLIEATSLLA